MCLAVLNSPKSFSDKKRLLHIASLKILINRNTVIWISFLSSFFVQDKAPELQPSAEEDISQEDWLSIKASLAQANEREELEKIKEDRVEYQEVPYVFHDHKNFLGIYDTYISLCVVVSSKSRSKYEWRAKMLLHTKMSCKRFIIQRFFSSFF